MPWLGRHCTLRTPFTYSHSILFRASHLHNGFHCGSSFTLDRIEEKNIGIKVENMKLIATCWSVMTTKVIL